MKTVKSILKGIYKRIPRKKDLFLGLKRFYTPSKRIYQHLYFQDDIKVDLDDDHGFEIRHYGFQVENDLFWKGIFNGWEKVSLRIWYELCQDANVVFDIGANTGVYCLMAKAIRPEAQVHAFEPVARVFEKLSTNVHLNGFDIKCIEKAVSDTDGTATIYDKDAEHTYSVTVNKDISSDHENSIPVEIETIRLDSYISSNNIDGIDLMKIDVETHEVEALSGMGEYLREFKPTLLIEILNDEVASGITSLIEDIDYHFYNIDENDGVRRVTELSKSDYFNYLICRPEIAEKLESLKSFGL